MPRQMSKEEAEELMEDWYELELEAQVEQARVSELENKAGPLTDAESTEYFEHLARIEEIREDQKEIFDKLKDGHGFGL